MRYFDEGDQVRVLEGKYKGESGIILSVNENEVEKPTLKIDSLGLEISINTVNLRMKDLYETDQKNAQRQRLDFNRKKKNELDLIKQRSHENVYKVGDIVLYEGNKTHGYVIKVEHDLIYVVNEHCRQAHLRFNEIDKKIPMNKTKLLRDSKGIVITIDDPVKVINRRSNFYE